MGTLPNHPAADIFPPMDAARFESLKASIASEGLLHPVVVHGGQVIDGRNRIKACDELGIACETIEHIGDPYLYAWIANGERRDLSAEQRYESWHKAAEHSGELKRQLKEIEDKANQARSEAAKAQHAKSNPRAGEKSGGPTTSGATKHSKAGSESLAAASHTNRGAVERMEKIRKARPDLADKVRTGEIKPTEALRQIKKEQVADKVRALPDGKYRVIYADPPWQYNDTREGLGEDGGVDRASTAAENHYPTMSKEELKALDVKALAADDCVLFCWATFPLLPDQLEVVKAWGFTYKTAFVWHKSRGTYGHYHKADAELLLVCTKGSATPDSEVRESQVQSGERTEHSRKPELFRALIDRMYLIPAGLSKPDRIELFRRGIAPSGWEIWGAEIEEAA